MPNSTIGSHGTALPPRVQMRREYAGPTWLKNGFRPFFMGAGLWALISMGLWLFSLQGYFEFSTVSHFTPVVWHTHEMLFGFVSAAITGFLLTAIPNWTGRLPIRGGPLLALFILWAAGRIGTILSQWIGPLFALVIDDIYLVLLAAVLTNEVLAGRNWRNLRVVAIIAALAICHIWFDVAAANFKHPPQWIEDLDPFIPARVAIVLITLLLTVIGGRIVPSFTRNWLVKHKVENLPQSWGWLDLAAILATLVAGGAWAIDPLNLLTALFCILAAGLQALRLSRWRGLATLSEPILWILHVGYSWIPLALMLIALSILLPGLSQQAGLHALTAGAMGTMILAVMTRATRGHTGHDLSADRITTALYLCVIASALTRITAALLPQFHDSLIISSGLLWIVGFALFTWRYAPMMFGK